MADDGDGAAKPEAVARPCPVCGKPASRRYRPFCSARCQTIDLARWIGGNYRVPSADDAPGDDDGGTDQES
jgi:uncharacterized protein